VDPEAPAQLVESAPPLPEPEAEDDFEMASEGADPRPSAR